MLGSGSYGTSPITPRFCPAPDIFSSGAYVWNAIQLHTGAGVAIKFEMISSDEPQTLPYEAAIYAQLEGVRGIPKIHWSGQESNAHFLVMDKLGPDLEKMRRFCRGEMSLKTVLMLAEQMLTIIEEVHARGIIVRDIKPENFAMGLVEEYKRLHLLDMGLCKLYLDPLTGKHMPFREGRGGIGTPRYASHNIHFGLEPSRRDDVEGIGILLLYLLHGRLPWQGICAPDIPTKLLRVGQMKRGKPFEDLLTQSPAFFGPFFEHCRSLAFEEKPDYAYLRTLLQQTMEERGWEYDWEYDWWSPGERGTLLPSEYKLDMCFVQPVRHRQDVL
ncbi:kinase-like protein [Wolfiporia cocos MD-104 SS10]|uniref:Kinase-like protein n=1 Tax=Wolfiporia cocos (strain MD-104) TaxID=742152 RepID=A0A2H3JED7_WOLCO|nr:kinase-like protein [Wolfiporia cocos MD-104 SS10]